MVTSTVLAVVVYTIYYGVYRYYTSLLRESSSADTAGAVESTDQAEEDKTGEGEGTLFLYIMMTLQVMRSQQKKIEEQRLIIEHLKHQVEKSEELVNCSDSEINALSKVPSLQATKWQKTESPKIPSEKLTVKVETNDIVDDSDSAINTDSGSETGKSNMTKLSKVPRLSRSLSDVHVCKKLCEQYLNRGEQQHTLYPNHRSIQRPRDVKKRHWRKSICIDSTVSSLGDILIS